ncbi:MAG: alpha/beta hydrolase [Pseudomonadota bacterium]
MRDFRIKTTGAEIAVRMAGAGPALILLHGFPQNHRCWLPALPALSQRFTCILVDLRGYGDSSVPPDDPDHSVYSKRAMAQDIADLMDSLKLKKAHVLGHDRGARVAYRMALDHPDRIGKLGIVEILPTSSFWQDWSAEIAMKAYHWTFLAQAAPLPEMLIAGSPAAYTDLILTRWSQSGSLKTFLPDALNSYRAQMTNPNRCAAFCADYRAGAGTDRQHDLADVEAGHKIRVPVKILCGQNGFAASGGKILEKWSVFAEQVLVDTCDGGHFIPEENPTALGRSFIDFFSA